MKSQPNACAMRSLPTKNGGGDGVGDVARPGSRANLAAGRLTRELRAKRGSYCDPPPKPQRPRPRKRSRGGRTKTTRRQWVCQARHRRRGRQRWRGTTRACCRCRRRRRPLRGQPMMARRREPLRSPPPPCPPPHGGRWKTTGGSRTRVGPLPSRRYRNPVPYPHAPKAVGGGWRRSQRQEERRRCGRRSLRENRARLHPCPRQPPVWPRLRAEDSLGTLACR
jgi:hypothetical protein